MTIYSLDLLLSRFGTICCSMSNSNCCFLTWYTFLRRHVRWSSIPVSLRIFQLVVIHTGKGFGVVSKAEDVFLELSCFLFGPADVGNLISGSSAFSKTSLNIWKCMYCWSLSWRILSITLPVCEMSEIVWSFEHSLALPFFRIGMKTDLFQFCGHFWVFQICWHIECSTFTASTFRIWNSSTGIPSPPLTLFIVMLPKAHLTSHSRMSGSRWVITPSWLSGSWRSFFVQFFCVFLLPLLSYFCCC